MKGLFSYDGYLGQLINRSIDIVCLSFLWILFSLPLFTIGAASSAIYYTVVKVFRQGEGHLLGAFWHSFKQNFKQATAAWMFFLIFYIIFPINGYFGYAFYATDVMPLGILVVIAVIAVIIMVWSDFLFAYLARFHDTAKTAAKNCIYMMIMHFPVSLAILAIMIGTAVLVVCVPLGLAFAPVVCAWLSSLVLEPVFRKYMSAEDLEAEGYAIPESAE